MSATGKHRKPRLKTIVRLAIATGVAGAAVGLPVTAASAHGTADHHGAEARHAVADTAAQAPVAAAPVADTTPAAAASHGYKVVSGDTLSKIATAQNVDGGWQKLYQDNRSVVGSNPNLIYPGQQLTIGGAAAAAPVQHAAPAAKPAAQPKPAQQAAKPAPQPVQQQAAKPAPKPAAQTQAAVASNASGYVAPVSVHHTTGWHVAGSNWSSGYHTGIDFPVSTGTSLKAIASGTVVSAGNGGAYGNQVIIKLADGKYAQYAHLSSISVSAGQTVSAGQQIGLSGATGNVTGPHLHFEIRTTPNYGSDIDPIAYLAAHGVSV
ncbi:M23 family metallopeptidase [Kitasatospora paracochleata]|uniref:Murein DD-endopeptidase MepM/ murein hydrolase activator NlpD n=1 Tax=Kitasatospora paracochleata TaxID=58354 RepID=A0ABT1IYX9_9ACTN|nr:LysM peptidoglycan-binding domain-containing M23 family metallopeptidase [Kitasatospora paracochleata]MCP2310359.1 murein DD-endopeptidase MepM/ murein hydrolase activator NlpD [Kitasatospora paracochleata]